MFRCYIYTNYTPVGGRPVHRNATYRCYDTKCCVILFFFIISSLNASKCFEHYVLIIMRSKLHCTASGIVTICRWPSGAQVGR